MAYHGYLGLMCNFSRAFFEKYKKPPKILEIGVDSGITGFALLNNLTAFKCPHIYTGVDILIKDFVEVYYLDYMTLKLNDTKIFLKEENSLFYLERAVKEKEKFDLILVDGDHNYNTVKKECELLHNLCHDDTLIIFDDYDGKYKEKDLYYSDREEYSHVKNQMENKGKANENVGLKAPIDNFIKKNNFISFKQMPGPPVCVINKNNSIIKMNDEESTGEK